MGRPIQILQVHRSARLRLLVGMMILIAYNVAFMTYPIALADDDVDWCAEVTRRLSEATRLERRYPAVALKALSEAKAIANEHFGPRDWKTLEAASRIDQLTRWSHLSAAERARFDQALSESRHAMRIRHAQGPDFAIEVQRRVVAEVARIVGTDVPEYATELEQLGTLELACGNTNIALTMKLDALKVLIEQLGAEHSTTVHLMAGIGYTLVSLDHPDIAKTVVVRGFRMATERNERGQELALAHLHLGHCEYGLQQWQSALRHCDEAIAAVEDDRPESLTATALFGFFWVFSGSKW